MSGFIQVSNPISGEVGAAATVMINPCNNQSAMFQTPSAGRWVLQHNMTDNRMNYGVWFQTPSAGRWVLQQDPIMAGYCQESEEVFQTPSAGRWVLQHGFFE